jgi:predicted transcriptional regulator
MHMRACYENSMRTTIEITDEQRSKLLALAASRGMKGFSALVREALDDYLEARTLDGEIIDAALHTKGSLSAAEADELESNCRSIRKSWR